MANQSFPQCAVPGTTLTIQEIHAAARQAPLIENPVGVILFITYIVVALGCLGYLLFELVSLYKHRLGMNVKKDRAFKMRLILLSILFFASFGRLSFNMLSFLNDSFKGYLAATSRATPTSTLDLLEHLWEWSHHSQLFTDFAWSLLASPSAWAQSQTGLLATLHGSLVLTALRTTYALPLDVSICYFLLAQILPTSCALSLLLINLLLLHPTAEADMLAELLAPFQSDEPQPRAALPVLLATALRLYLPYIPCSVNSGQLLAQVAATRGFLAGLWLLDLDLGPTAVTAAASLLFDYFQGTKGEWFAAAGAAGENWAVRTLAVDVGMVMLVLANGAVVLYSRKIEGVGELEGEEQTKKIQ